MATVLAVVGAGLLGVTTSGATSVAKPVINALTATPPKVTAVGGSTTITAAVQNATACKVESLPALLGGSGAVSCAAGSVADPLLFPTNPAAITYLVILTAKGPAGNTSATIKVKVHGGAGGGMAGVATTVSDGEGSCALLASTGQVECWGYGMNGQLGNDQIYSSSPFGSADPVQVEGETGNGTLKGVTSLLGVNGDGYCAVLDSTKVDCWGFGQEGGLGDGQFADSALPVPVQDVGGSSTLSGVESLATDGLGVCALVVGGAVDCWGYGPNGELGNGQDYTTSPFGSATPVQVSDVAQDGGILLGASSLSGGGDGYCALLVSGGVDCWGNGSSAAPVPVPDVDQDGGVLSGVTNVTSDSTGTVCATITTGGVDCWGIGTGGELGNGQEADSTSPVQVDGVVGGTAALAGVSELVSDQDGFCALVASGAVDCWGNGTFGILGDGKYSSSATPVQVDGMGGGAALHRATSLTGDGNGFCVALKTQGAIACWGEGADGALGNGQYSPGPTDGSADPVQVEGVGGTGQLSGVASLMGGGDGYCALLTSSEVDCWGYGLDGELGNGQYYSNPDGFDLPVEVL